MTDQDNGNHLLKSPRTVTEIRLEYDSDKPGTKILQE